MSEEFKIAINDRFKDPQIAAILAEIPDCPAGQYVNMCGGTTSKRGPKSERVKRTPSKYQKFIGQCLRDKHLKGFDPKAMKDCAGTWQEMKKSGNGST